LHFLDFVDFDESSEDEVLQRREVWRRSCCDD
jgi:hypothetical protein